ncbi:transmembrane protein 192 [Pholidichthys leucotaenia]
MDSKGPSLYPRAGSAADMTLSLEEDSLVDGPLISADALHSAIRREFQTMPTFYHAFLLSLLHVLYLVLSISVAVLCVLKFSQEDICTSILDHVPANSVIVFGKVFLWVLVLLFTTCVHHHHSRVRKRGYLRFYREMQAVKHLPLSIHSTGNVLVLVLLQAIRFSQRARTYALLGILVLEFLVAVPCLIYYSVKVFQFNKDRAAPDVNQEELSHNYSVTSLPTETGFRGASNLEEVVEKQADLIEYLKQHNALLSQRLLNLSAQH